MWIGQPWRSPGSRWIGSRQERRREVGRLTKRSPGHFETIWRRRPRRVRTSVARRQRGVECELNPPTWGCTTTSETGPRRWRSIDGAGRLYHVDAVGSGGACESLAHQVRQRTDTLRSDSCPKRRTVVPGRRTEDPPAAYAVNVAVREGFHGRVGSTRIALRAPATAHRPHHSRKVRWPGRRSKLEDCRRRRSWA